MTEDSTKVSEKNEKKSNLGWIGLLVGALGGALGGLLFAPKPGKEFREDLKRLYSDVYAEIIERSKGLDNLTRQSYEKIVDEVVTKYKPVMKKTKDEIEAWIVQLKEEWPSIAEHIKKASGQVTSKSPAKKKK
jgi:gas vesicle protein